MRILQVASEAFPLVKTGGLADVVSGLSNALIAAGDDIRLLLPAYRGTAIAAQARPFCQLGDPLGLGPTRLLQGKVPGTEVTVWLLDAPELFDRPGGPYLDESGHDWPDNHLRFGLLGRVAALLAHLGPVLGWTPELVHCHDWQAGLTPAHLALWGGRRPATLLTIHNLHFRGMFDPAALPAVGLPMSCFDMYGVELYGAASFLKGGLYYADALSTVSPTYALEIQQPLGGEGLHGLLSGRSEHLHGILNGIDESLWDPSSDPNLVGAYDQHRLQDKAPNKVELQRSFELAVDPNVPLVGSVGRLSSQKGIDLLLGALPSLLKAGAQVAVIGSGDGALEQALAQAAAANPGRIGFFRGYHEPLSHKMFAGADMLVVPSRFEPCGLTQMYAMRYGTIPVVRRTGGLHDTVIDADDPDGVGFTFFDPTAQSLSQALERALVAFEDEPQWRTLQRRGMQRAFGWRDPARQYRALYAQLAGAESEAQTIPVAAKPSELTMLGQQTRSA